MTFKNILICKTGKVIALTIFILKLILPKLVYTFTGGLSEDYQVNIKMLLLFIVGI